MKAQNSLKTADKYNMENLPTDVKSDVEKIIWKDLAEAETQDKIQEIINKHRQNSELAMIFVKHLDPQLLKWFSPNVQAQIAVNLIDSHREAFDNLSINTKNSNFFIENLIISFVKTWKTPLDVEDFIRMNYSEKSQKEIFKNNDIGSIFKAIKWNFETSKNSQNIYFVNLKQKYPDFYKAILEKNIIEESEQSGDITISDNLINLIINNYKNDSRFDLDLSLWAILWLWNFIQKEYYHELREFIYQELIKHPQIKLEIKLQQEKLKQAEEKLKNKQEEKPENKNNKDKISNKTEDENDDFEISNISSSSGIDFWWWIVLHETKLENKWEKIKMPTNIARWLNDANIANFIEFYELLKKVKLNFLWDKYNREFLTLLSNKNIDLIWSIKTWNYENTTLNMLNFLWKNIWIIWNVKTKTWNINEHWDEESTTKQVDPFNTLAWAINAFWSIADTEKINSKQYSSPVYSPIELYMIEHHLINPKIPYLNINNFK